MSECKPVLKGEGEKLHTCSGYRIKKRESGQTISGIKRNHFISEAGRAKILKNPAFIQGK